MQDKKGTNSELHERHELFFNADCADYTDERRKIQDARFKTKDKTARPAAVGGDCPALSIINSIKSLPAALLIQVLLKRNSSIMLAKCSILTPSFSIRGSSSGCLTSLTTSSYCHFPILFFYFIGQPP